MNFDLDAEDLALQSAIRDVCKRHFPMERVRMMERVDDQAWRALADAGVFSLTLSEEEGGASLGMRHALLVFEELGRALVPGPVVATFLAAGLVHGVTSGAKRAGILRRGVWTAEHLESVDELVLLDREAMWRIDPRSLDAEPVAEPLDPLTPLHRFREIATWDAIGGEADAMRWRLRGTALTAALALGIASATTEAATAYAKERVQFGRTIGSFQAVTHMLADMLVRAEVARAAVYAAGCVLDDPAAGDVEVAVASAKLLACEAALANGKASIQVHGGMGFTWEVDAHLFVKRAAVLATHFGDAAEHASTVADALFAERSL